MAKPNRRRTDACRPSPVGPEVLLTSGDEATVEGGEEPPAHVREFLERETDHPPVDSRERRFKEVRIDVDEPVLVAGQADPDVAADLDEPTTTAIAECGDAPRFYVTDNPDRGLGSWLVREAFVYFLVAAILLAIAYSLLAS